MEDLQENAVEETKASEEPNDVIQGVQHEDAIAELFEPEVRRAEEETETEAKVDVADALDSTISAVDEDVEAPTAQESGNVEAELRAQIAELMREMQELRNSGAAAGTTPEPLKLPESPSEVTTVDFLGGEDPADFLTDPEKFNKILNVVATVAARSAVASAKESTLRAIPEIVQRSTQQQTEINKSVDGFYAANPDLVPFKNMVSMAATQVYSSDPTMKLEAILENAAVKVRDVLKLRKTQVSVTPAQPVVAGSAGAKRPAPFNLSEEQRQIAELFG